MFLLLQGIQTLHKNSMKPSGAGLGASFSDCYSSPGFEEKYLERGR
jgi:hypothetical protein